jgi:nitrous oxidase accessory protein
MRQLFACLFLIFIAQPAVAKEWRVEPGDSIAGAINSARAGDTIRVERGYFHERIVINKPLALVGINRPTISGDNQPGDVIRINSTDVQVEGFIIRDSGDNLTAQNAGIYLAPGSHRALIRHNDIAYSLFGLWIEKANDVQIVGNLITGKRDYQSAQRGNGIQLYNTMGASIVGNNISFTRDGIYVDVSHNALFRRNKMHHLRYGTHYMNSYFNVWEDNDTYLNRGGLALMEVRNITVRNNRAWGNSDHGIMLRTIQDSIIEDNVVAGNNRGFFIYDAEYNIIKHNLLVNNRVGVHLWAGSKNNQVDGNDLINNQSQIKYVAANDDVWGGGQGNYWSNYLGWDRDGNGIGDTPYEANDIVDHLTWKYPMTRILLNSPAVQTLRLVAQQFPLLRAPSVVDHNPRMSPYHEDWSSWLDKKRY